MQRVQLVILSDQLPAAYLPVAALKPDAVVAVVTAKMKKGRKDDNFAALLTPLGYTAGINLHFLSDMPESGVAALWDWGLNLLADERWQGWHWDFNATGGTKLMALALAPLFQGAEFRVLYQDTGSDRIEWISPPDLPPVAVADQFTAPLHFRAYGATWRRAQSDVDAWQQLARQRFGVARQLARIAAQDEGFIRALNRVAANAVKREGLHDRIVAPLQTLSYPPKGQKAELFKRLDELGVVGWSGDEPEQVDFHNIDGWRFITGGWLEEYAWNCARDAGLDDVHCGVELTDDYDKKANIRNELDLVIQHRNRLLVVECKTAKLGDESKDANIINKLDSIATRWGGLFATRVLLSALPLNHTTAARRDVNTEQRAEASGIALSMGDELLHLTESFRHWMTQGQWQAEQKLLNT